MRSVVALLSVILAWSAVASADATPARHSWEIRARVLSAGVPEFAWNRLMLFREENIGRTYETDVYTCAEREATDLRTCGDEKRTPAKKQIELQPHRYAAIMDFRSPSTEKRLFLIDLQTGEVKRYMVAHGKGSGDAAVPSRFSNVKNSKATSLGMYVAGQTYKGGYGSTLRMHGLEFTNDRAYDRDIVMHAAWYASEKFINRKNKKTGQPYGRLGVSWGCPAVAPEVARVIIPLLKEGGLILHVGADW